MVVKEYVAMLAKFMHPVFVKAVNPEETNHCSRLKRLSLPINGGSIMCNISVLGDCIGSCLAGDQSF